MTHSDDEGVLKPGVIPLRPLTLREIFSGAIAYIRAIPKATLGLTTIVAVRVKVGETIGYSIGVAPLFRRLSNQV